MMLLAGEAQRAVYPVAGAFKAESRSDIDIMVASKARHLTPEGHVAESELSIAAVCG